MHALEERLPKFRSILTDEIGVQCSAFIRQVSDIPRLYRRTNREVRRLLYGVSFDIICSTCIGTSLRVLLFRSIIKFALCSSWISCLCFSPPSIMTSHIIVRMFSNTWLLSAKLEPLPANVNAAGIGHQRHQSATVLISHKVCLV